jgi:hypothetical protein
MSGTMSDTKTLFVVRDGAAADAIVVSADAVVAKGGQSASWDDVTFPAPEGASFVDQGGAAIGWLLHKGKLVAPSEPEAPAAPPRTTFDLLGFFDLFTEAEQGAIVSSDNVQVKLFCLMAAGTNSVDLKDPKIVAGVKQFESLGLIEKGRAAKVLAGEAPTAS